MRRLLCVLLLVVVVAACGDDDAPAADAGRTSTTATGADVVESDEPAGSVPSDTASPDEGRDEPLVLVAELTADAAVPPPGDPAGTGRIEIQAEGPGRLCVDMVAIGLDSAVTDAHVHSGPTGDTGAPVLPIGPPTRADGDTDVWRDVCVDVDAAVVQQLEDDPAGHYANVHTETHPDSALRGQLQAASIFDLTLS